MAQCHRYPPTPPYPTAYCLVGSCTVQAPPPPVPLPYPTFARPPPAHWGAPPPPFIYIRPYFLGFCNWGVGLLFGPAALWGFAKVKGNYSRFDALRRFGLPPSLRSVATRASPRFLWFSFRSPYGQSSMPSPGEPSPYPVPDLNDVHSM